MDTIRPKMTFTKTPSRTYSNATVQWGVSEPVNGSCEIRGPSNFYRNVSCDRSWVGLNLPPGSFTLSIMVIDTSGNIGGPSSHTWINGTVPNAGFEINICNLICKLNTPNLHNQNQILKWQLSVSPVTQYTVLFYWHMYHVWYGNQTSLLFIILFTTYFINSDYRGCYTAITSVGRFNSIPN